MSTSLLQLVDNLQQAGKIRNLQQVCGVSGCVYDRHYIYIKENFSYITIIYYLNLKSGKEVNCLNSLWCVRKQLYNKYVKQLMELAERKLKGNLFQRPIAAGVRYRKVVCDNIVAGGLS